MVPHDMVLFNFICPCIQQVASGGADAPLADSTLPKHWMRDFYLASLCLQSRENEEGLGRLQV